MKPEIREGWVYIPPSEPDLLEQLIGTPKQRYKTKRSLERYKKRYGKDKPMPEMILGYFEGFKFIHEE